MRILFLHSGRQRANMNGNIWSKEKLQFRMMVVEGHKIKMGLVCSQNPRESTFSDTTKDRNKTWGLKYVN